MLDAVAELDYVPSLMARGLSKSQTYILALVIPYTPDYLYSDPHLLELIRGIDDEARSRHYSLLLSTGGASPLDSPATVPRTADPPGCIGVVMSMGSS